MYKKMISRSEILCVVVGSLIANPTVTASHPYRLYHPGEVVNHALEADAYPNLCYGQSHDLFQQSLRPFPLPFLGGHWAEEDWNPLASDRHLVQPGLLLPIPHLPVAQVVQISSRWELELSQWCLLG
jgi:hypothetical protein